MFSVLEILLLLSDDSQQRPLSLSERWCREQGGQVEVVLPDQTRCDCVTETHAIEFDFGNQLTGAINMRLCLCFNYSTNKFIQ
jgi:hypothetical protein